MGRHGDPRVPGLGGRAGVHRGLALGGVAADCGVWQKIHADTNVICY